GRRGPHVGRGSLRRAREVGRGPARVRRGGRGLTVLWRRVASERPAPHEAGTVPRRRRRPRAGDGGPPGRQRVVVHPGNRGGPRGTFRLRRHILRRRITARRSRQGLVDRQGPFTHAAQAFRRRTLAFLLR